MEIEKKCTKCGEVKPVGEFHKCKTKKDGYFTQCKVCRKKHNKKYREENKDKRKEYFKKYREENKYKIKEYNKKYLEENGIVINKELYFVNTAPEELKPLLQIAINSRNKLRELKNITQGEQHG